MVICSYTNIVEHRPAYTTYGNGFRGGLYVEAGYACLGQSINSLKCSLLQNGAPSGLAYCRVWNYSTGMTPKVTLGSIDVSTITTDAGGQYYLFDSPDSTETLAVGDIMGIEFDGGDSTNNIKYGIEGAGGGGVAYQRLASSPGGAWNLSADDNFAYYLNDAPPPSSGGTRLPPPPIVLSGL